MNIDKYRHHLKTLKLDRKQEDEIITLIWKIMEHFVSAAFGKAPVQQALRERNKNSIQDSRPVIDSNYSKTTGEADT
ncbi:MAG: hypothetical protein ACRBCK_08520 [Alphaproteobacteria bacterium]